MSPSSDPDGSSRASGSPGSLPSRFEPKPIEQRWQEAWESARIFRGLERPHRTPFTLTLPPPNVTGVLTMGHMLGDTVMDTLVRRARMQGRPTLWVPGLDHAGSATQIEVRRRLSKQGVRFESLPRAEALRQVELWKEEHEARIREQTRAGGFSVDWSRFRYTMDAGAVRATREAFVQLYRAGLIYRGERLVNWDPSLETAISDLEVVHSEEEGSLYTLLYAWADGTPGGVEVATARPETLFGDVAVAVHPDDDARHASAVGRAVRRPARRPKCAGHHRPWRSTPRSEPARSRSPRATTRWITRSTSGTPRSGYRRTSSTPAPASPALLSRAMYQGLDRDRARAKAVEALEGQGSSYGPRSSAIRWPVPSARKRWSSPDSRSNGSCGWLASPTPVVGAVREGKIRIHPARWEPTFFRWMEGIQDWCISRQVLWGHPIPVYRCRPHGHEFASVEEPTGLPLLHQP